MNKIKRQEWFYWNVKRRGSGFLPWLGRIVPDKIKYWVVISVAVRTAQRDDGHPGEPTALEMLDHLDGRKRRKTGTLGVLYCPELSSHEKHYWTNFDIDANVSEKVECPGL